MPPGRKPTRTREEFIEAAIAFADTAGLDALTLRGLAESMGCATTAVYRYFQDKNDLITGMRDSLLDEALEPEALTQAQPLARERIINAALRFRNAAHQHPSLSQIMNLPALEGTSPMTIPYFLIDALSQLGLQRHLLVRGYRQLETLIVGSSAYDFSGAPSHIQDRLHRMQNLNHPAFNAILTDESSVDSDNELAFLTNLTCILDALISEAALEQ